MKNIKLKPFAETAKVWSKQSTCARLKVGAIIYNRKNKRVLAIGYNGTIAGQQHCNALFSYSDGKYFINTKLSLFLDLTVIVDLPKGWVQVDKVAWLDLHHKFSEQYEVHAEQNAIYNLFKTGTDWQEEDMSIITTTEPCVQCAKAIAALGIKECYYIAEYDRSDDGIDEFFEKTGVHYARYNES